MGSRVILRVTDRITEFEMKKKKRGRDKGGNWNNTQVSDLGKNWEEKKSEWPERD